MAHTHAKPGSQSGERVPPAGEADAFLLALTLVLGLGVCLRFVDYAYDDAYITYRYAWNIVAGNGFVYNLEHNFLGTTTPLYTLILALLGHLLPIPIASGLVSTASLLGGLYCVDRLGGAAGVRFAGPLSAAFLVFEPQIFHIFGGETLLVYFGLVPLGYWLHVSGRRRAAAFVFGLAILARMDACLFAALLYADDVRQRRRLPFTECAVLGLTLLPWLVYATLAFGSPLPSTLWAKIAQGEAGSWALFFDGSRRYLAALIPFASPFALLWLLVLVAGLVRVFVRERIFLIFVVNSALFALIYQFVLQTSFSHWYLANTYVTIALLLAAGLRAGWAGVRWLGTRLGASERLGRHIATGVLAIALVWQCTTGGAALRAFQLDPPRRAIYTRLGHWLAANTTPDATVAYFEIGYLGYFSRRTIIDPVGLVTPGGLERIKRGELLWIFEAYEVDYYVHNPAMGRAALIERPWFKQRYRPVERFEQKGFRQGLVLYARNGVSPEPQ